MLNKGTVMKKYSKLYNDIKEQIITGQLSHGDKIPSVRDAAAIYSVSTTTVQNLNYVQTDTLYLKKKAAILYQFSIRKIKLKIQKKVKLKSNTIFAANRQTLKALMYRSGKDILKMRLDKKTDC